MFSQPGVEQCLVAHSVQGWYHDVRVPHLVSLHLYLGDLVDPWGPLPLDGDLVVDDGEGARGEGYGGGVANELAQLFPVLHLAVP